MGDPAHTYILFELAGTTYAVRSAAVEQMEMVEEITPVPGTAPYVAGVVYARGQVVPALDLRARFGLERAAHDTRTRLIVARQGERLVGLIVDSAREFVAIAPDAVQPPPEAIGGLSGHYLEGIAVLGDRLVLLLNVAEVLSAAGQALPGGESV